MEQIIYEKAYPKRNQDELATLPSQSGAPTPDSFLKQLETSYTCILIPERQRAARSFVQLARKISELYELDIKITEYDTHISVSYYFNAGGGLRCFKDPAVYADDVTFFSNVNGYEIVMCLDYYTHAVINKKRRLYP